MRNKYFYNFDFDNFHKMVRSVDETIKVFNELYRIRWRLNEYDEIKFFLENNNISIDKRKQIILQFIANFEDDVSSYTIAIVFFLMQEKVFHKLGYFINILKIYYAEKADLIMVEVISRFPISDESLEPYRQKLEGQYHKKVEYIRKIRTSLLGGFKLRWHVGEIDLTVKRKLSDMKKQIEQGR